MHKPTLPLQRAYTQCNYKFITVDSHATSDQNTGAPGPRGQSAVDTVWSASVLESCCPCV